MLHCKTGGLDYIVITREDITTAVQTDERLLKCTNI